MTECILPASSTTADRSSIERRSSRREPILTPGSLQLVARDDPSDLPNNRSLDDVICNELDAAFARSMDVLVVDVSLGGVGIRSIEPLDDTRFYSLTIGAGPLHLSATFRVIRMRRRPDGMYEIGAEFC